MKQVGIKKIKNTCRLLRAYFPACEGRNINKKRLKVLEALRAFNFTDARENNIKNGLAALHACSFANARKINIKKALAIILTFSLAASLLYGCAGAGSSSETGDGDESISAEGSSGQDENDGTENDGVESEETDETNKETVSNENAVVISDKEYIEETLNLANNSNQEWTYSKSGDAWTLSVVSAVVYPEIENEQGVSVCVPGAYVKGIDTDGDGTEDVTGSSAQSAVKGSLVIDYDAEITSSNGQTYTASKAPVIVNTGAAGYGSSNNNTAPATYAKEGYINVSCGNRGKQDTAVDENGNTYYTGDAPSCLVDQKDAVRFVKYNILLGNLPGSVDYFVSTGGSGGAAHAAMLAATSNNPDFYDYEIEAGAVGVYALDNGGYSTTVTIDGEDYELSDGLWGCIAYSAITSLAEADMAMAFEYYLDTSYKFGSNFQAKLAEYLAEEYMDYINDQNLTLSESLVGFDLNGDGDTKDTVELKIDYDEDLYADTNGYGGTYLNLYLAEFEENLQWYIDNLDYAQGWTWFGTDGKALSDSEVASMTSADKAEAFIEGRYTASSSGGFGSGNMDPIGNFNDTPDDAGGPGGDLPGDTSGGLPDGGPEGDIGGSGGDMPGDTSGGLSDSGPGGDNISIGSNSEALGGDSGTPGGDSVSLGGNNEAPGGNMLGNTSEGLSDGGPDENMSVGMSLDLSDSGSGENRSVYTSLDLSEQSTAGVTSAGTTKAALTASASGTAGTSGAVAVTSLSGTAGTSGAVAVTSLSGTAGTSGAVAVTSSSGTAGNAAAALATDPAQSAVGISATATAGATTATSAISIAQSAVGTPIAGTTQAAGSGRDSSNYSSFDDMLSAYQSEIAQIEEGDEYGKNIVELYNPLNYIGADGTDGPAWFRVVMGATEGDMSMFSSLNMEIAMLNAGVDANIEWQWGGGHVPSEVLSGSFTLYVDQMYGEHAGGTIIETPAASKQTENGTSTSASGKDLSGWVDYTDITSVSFTLASAASYRTSGASKAIPGFDVIDYGQEDYVFGNDSQDARHWDKYVLKAFEEHADELAALFNAG